MASTTTRRNPNILAATRRNVVQLGKYRVKVGWSIDMGAEASTVAIATYNTLGTATIPARDALTPTLSANLDLIRTANAEAVRAAHRGDDPVPDLETLASTLEYEFKKSIEAFSSPPNSPSTVDSKKFDDPLIGPGADGGRLYDQAAARVTSR